VFCGHYKQALPLNLLQHKFKLKRKSSGYWHHWRLAASLAAAWLVLNLGVTGFQYMQLQDENSISKAHRLVNCGIQVNWSIVDLIIECPFDIWISRMKNVQVTVFFVMINLNTLIPERCSLILSSAGRCLN